MPAGAVEEDDGMGVRGDLAADLLKVQVHRPVVGARGKTSAAPLSCSAQTAPKR